MPGPTISLLVRAARRLRRIFLSLAVALRCDGTRPKANSITR